MDDDKDFLEELSRSYFTSPNYDEFVSNEDTMASSQPEISAEAASRQPELSVEAASCQPESSAVAASHQPKVRVQKRDCVACGDTKDPVDLSKAPCEHEYCGDCLTHLFQDAMDTEFLFPPQCCKHPIPFEENRHFLDAEVARKFPEKELEYSTSNRTYCHNPLCVSFIPQNRHEDSVAVCGECDARTCIACKRASHDGDCPDDAELQEVLRMAEAQGWQRCTNCRNLVELNRGCNHVM